MLFIVRVSQFLFDESYRKFLLSHVFSNDIFTHIDQYLCCCVQCIAFETRGVWALRPILFTSYGLFWTTSGGYAMRRLGTASRVTGTDLEFTLSYEIIDT